MTTRVFFTVDTELSVGSHARGLDVEENLRRSMFGGDAGVGVDWQAERFAAAGLKAVFFVDPMPSLLFGLDPIARTVDAILAQGQEVQLHIHTEWLTWLDAPPVAGPVRPNIGDYSLDDQVRLIGLARDRLVAAGAPAPVAFRAGNYGASDDTLRALAALGLRYDTSFNGAYLGDLCRIGLPADTQAPVDHLGITELPVSALHDWPRGLRPAQLCALSGWEMRAALDHAIARAAPAFTIVSHSFELLSRDRERPQLAVIDRFEALIELLADRAAMAPTSSYAGLDLAAAPADLPPARRNPIRTLHRMGAQLLAERYERA